MQILYTKNPIQHGNAIIVREVDKLDRKMIDWLAGRKLWVVETDFGNRMRLTDREIDEFYTRGDERSYKEWLFDKRMLMEQNHISDEGL